jgi:hypothetical protein
MSTTVNVPGQPPAPKHPVAFVCHFAFKAAAVVYYILCELVNKNQFVTNFVICIVLLAMDFWTVSPGTRHVATAVAAAAANSCAPAS